MPPRLNSDEIESRGVRVRMIVFAERFASGVWTEWEHRCSGDEVAVIEASAKAKSLDRASTNGVFFIDYLMAAECAFNVSRGGIRVPAEGDARVFGIAVGEMVFAMFARITRIF